jgi:hypothetical protein
VIWALAVGLALTAAQVLLVCLAANRSDLREAYRALVAYDGGWYTNIIVHGYGWVPPGLPPDHPGNVAFFPGYPCAAFLLERLTGLDAVFAMPLTAQLCAWGFWAYLLLLCRRWGVGRRAALAAALLLAVHPAGFYLVVAYSEALFLLAAVGFVYWSEQKGPTAAALAALHGAAMTATRLVGVVLVVYPLARAWLRCNWRREGVDAALRRGVGPLLLGAAAGLGVLAYFGYLQFRFGRWDLYLRAQEQGWGVKPNYLGLFTPRLLLALWPGSFRRFVDPCYLSRASVPLLTLGLLGVLAAEVWLALRRRARGRGERLAVYLAAFLLLWVPASAYFSQDWLSMARYGLPVLALLLPAALRLRARSSPPPTPRWAWLALAAGLLASLGVHLAMAYRYTHGLWVA